MQNYIEDQKCLKYSAFYNSLTCENISHRIRSLPINYHSGTFVKSANIENYRSKIFQSESNRACANTFCSRDINAYQFARIN